jgi:hypothetical protein
MILLIFASQADRISGVSHSWLQILLEPLPSGKSLFSGFHYAIFIHVKISFYCHPQKMFKCVNKCFRGKSRENYLILLASENLLWSWVCQWLIFVILATQEAEIRRIMVQSQPQANS